MCIFKKQTFSVLLYLFTLLFQCSACSQSTDSYDIYWVVSGMDNPTDMRWGNYLRDHLNRRAGNKKIAVLDNPLTDDCLQVMVHVDSLYGYDYSIFRDGDMVRLIARDDTKMLWLIYQFISALGDERVNVADLPPAMIKLDGCEGNFAFEYRCVYSSANSDPELMPITASHNIDYDWGLWGHNLRRVFHGDIPEDAWASVNGKRTPGQFCFSSESLYKAVESYVVDNFGEGKDGKGATRFVIMPEDDETICSCSACLAAGNTTRSATPAVSNILRRLATRFPNHQFFTSAYLSTYTPPIGVMPSNVGVIISAMEVPMQAYLSAESAKVKNFSRMVTQWKKATKKVYVWDYMRNFDDYLTPYPCLSMIGERLRYFRSMGVSGIIYNGSGTDYASFDDVQTAAIAAMLINPDLNVENYVASCIHRYYPVSGAILEKAYRSWETKACEKRKVLPFYGGIEDAVHSWLNPEDFEAFCDALDKKSKDIRDEERMRLNKLLTALQFTRLELQRMPHGHYNSSIVQTCLESLEGHTAFDCMRNYREANGDLDKYICEWKVLKSENENSHSLLKGVRLKSKYKMDAGYTDLSILTDGFYALPSDYHTGWLIASAQMMNIEVPAGKIQNGLKMGLSFLYAPSWRIYLPEAIEIWQSGRHLYTIPFKADAEKKPFTKHRIQFSLKDIDASQALEVHVLQGKGRRPTMACEEIELF